MSKSITTAMHEAQIGNPVAAVGRVFRNAVRQIRREREIARAVRQLEAMSDTMLRDMGIERHQISHAARFGRRGDAWRYL